MSNIIIFLIGIYCYFSYLRLYSWDIIKIFLAKYQKKLNLGYRSKKTLKSDSIFLLRSLPYTSFCYISDSHIKTGFCHKLNGIQSSKHNMWTIPEYTLLGCKLCKKCSDSLKKAHFFILWVSLNEVLQYDQRFLQDIFCRLLIFHRI